MPHSDTGFRITDNEYRIPDNGYRNPKSGIRKGLLRYPVSGIRYGMAGQYTIEWALLLAAMVTAVGLMTHYVSYAFQANVKSTEMQLNSAMLDNRP